MIKITSECKIVNDGKMLFCTKHNRKHFWDYHHAHQGHLLYSLPINTTEGVKYKYLAWYCYTCNNDELVIQSIQ